MHMYLYYESGECNDALRDRNFFLIHARSIEEADHKLLEYYKRQREDDPTTPVWSLEDIKDQYAPILQGDNIEVADLGYSIQSLEIIQ